MKIKTGSYRSPTGWMRQRISERNVQPLDASEPIDDELWILLEYYSEIESVGMAFLESKGVKKRILKRVFKDFQAYIRQAKSYYYPAKKLHSRSAALLYYYCFLNLVKAGLVITQPEIGGKKIVHGINSLPKDFSKLKKQTVRILGDGIFPLFYKWHFGISINEQSLRVENLLNYCTDISYQYSLLGLGNGRKMLPGYYVHLINMNDKTGWPLIGIWDFKQCEKYNKSFQSFCSNFEKIDLDKTMGKQFFDLDPVQFNGFTFFQSKNVFNWPSANVVPTAETRQLILASFGNLLQSNYFEEGSDYYVSLPYSEKRQIPMDELVAIYIVMYHLSNLVRYGPSFLEELLSKKEAWLIDSFIKSCSLTFLRVIVSRIINTDYVIGIRE